MGQGVRLCTQLEVDLPNRAIAKNARAFLRLLIARRFWGLSECCYPVSRFERNDRTPPMFGSVKRSEPGEEDSKAWPESGSLDHSFFRSIAQGTPRSFLSWAHSDLVVSRCKGARYSGRGTFMLCLVDGSTSKTQLRSEKFC